MVTCVHFLWIYNQKWDAGSYGNSVVNFLRTLHTVLHCGCTSLPYGQRCARTPFLHILANTVISRLSDDGHSDRCEVIPRCGFSLHFPDSDIEHLPVDLLDICMSSLENCICSSSAYFLIAYSYYSHLH